MLRSKQKDLWSDIDLSPIPPLLFFPKNIDDHDDDDDDPTDQKAKEMFVFEIRHMRRALSANIFHARESRDKGGDDDDGDKGGHELMIVMVKKMMLTVTTIIMMIIMIVIIVIIMIMMKFDLKAFLWDKTRGRLWANVLFARGW